ncbi:hypothetical protein RRF57_012807 [Xylaria bambusicola]|uniref:Uncharacterized protein n=1 Tax=Xylaria bambusicola TaxID=326684 RepID=A0AAN7UQD6_9PEZI
MPSLRCAATSQHKSRTLWKHLAGDEVQLHWKILKGGPIWMVRPSQGHDDSELLTKETLLQLQRVANTVVPNSNPTCLGRALLAAEAQQKALDVVWP